MNIRYTLILAAFLGLVFSGCSSTKKNETNNDEQASTEKKKDNTPKTKEQQIITAVIAQHGGDKYKNAKISFDFRDIHYNYERNGGRYKYERSYKHDSLGQIHDVLTNDSFTRTLNGKETKVTEEWKGKYSNSINSVIYFTFLPFNLNDAAVVKKYLGEVSIKGQPYHQIQVTFKQEGGGEDHSDVYMYWTHKEKNTMDYFAYSYEVNEGGIRFREAFNPRVVKGITFLDYNNYKVKTGTPFNKIVKHFEAGNLKLLSKIENKNVKVELTK